VKLINKKKVIFLLSGTGSNLLKVLKKNLKSPKFSPVAIISNNYISKKIKELIVSNKLELKIYERITKLNPKFIGECDVIFSVGYLKKIEPQIIDNYEIINLHPSLLPKYKGLMTHKRMLINNETSYGYSIHKVTKYLDDGEILSQKKEKIKSSDEFELISNHKRVEHLNVYKDLIKLLN
jgi:phosphoribosylglycinamide formyltransferase-1